jgi:transposase-like protein
MEKPPMPKSMTTDLDALRAALVKVTPRQQIAAEALAGGATHAVAAEAAGVARETVTKWAGHHHGFRAALDLYRESLATEQTARMTRIREKALATIEKRLDDEATSLTDAVTVLRVVPPPSFGQDRQSIIAADLLATDVRRVGDNVPPPTPRSGANGRITRDMASMDQIMYDTAAEQIVRAERVALETLAEAAGVYDLDES